MEHGFQLLGGNWMMLRILIGIIPFFPTAAQRAAFFFFEILGEMRIDDKEIYLLTPTFLATFRRSETLILSQSCRLLGECLTRLSDRLDFFDRLDFLDRFDRLDFLDRFDRLDFLDRLDRLLRLDRLDRLLRLDRLDRLLPLDRLE